MIILEVAQGYTTNLSDRDKDEVVKEFERTDKARAERYPQTLPYHHQWWRVFEAPDNHTATWGYEWYQVMADGRLKMHSAQYDSSG